MTKKRIEELTIEDMKTLAISWKSTQEDFELFKWIYSHSNYSGFVKDILREKMNGESVSINSVKQTPVKVEKQQKQLLDLSF